MRIAINGFGRIGRSVVRQLLAGRAPEITLVAINDIAPLETLAYLFRYDSVFGPYHGTVDTDGDCLVLDGTPVRVTHETTLDALDLSGIDLLMECTGKHKSREALSGAITAGATSVLVSGPCDDDVPTVVLGANDDDLGDAPIVSNASCTTNALAPMLRLLDQGFGIEAGHMTTVHCYTNSQPLIDGPRGPLARSRAAAVSMIPTSTSATELFERVLPHLAGRVSGAALRVPTPSVSCIDAVLTLRDALPPDPQAWLQQAAEASPVLGWTKDPVVSSDLRMCPQSLVIALPETKTVGAHQLRVFGWYDNEWGFSARMIDMAGKIAARA